jgi:hypothetical protein
MSSPLARAKGDKLTVDIDNARQKRVLDGLAEEENQ